MYQTILILNDFKKVVWIKKFIDSLLLLKYRDTYIFIGMHKTNVTIITSPKKLNGERHQGEAT